MLEVKCFMCRARAEKRHPCVVFVGNVGLYIYGDENKLGRSVYGVEYYETMALGMKRVPIEIVLKEVEYWPYGINRVQRFIESANLDAVAYGIRTKEIFDGLKVGFMEVDDTLSARGSTHGDFRTNAQISQRFKDIVGPYRGKLNDQQSEALDMIFHKIARILAGDPNFKDHWHDIQGYAKLVEERL